MKILFLTRGVSKRGGCIVLTNLTRELRKRGYPVDLVAFKRSGDEDYPRNRAFWEDLNPTLIEIPKKTNTNQQNAEYFKAASDYLKGNSQKYDRIIIDSWFALIGAIKSGKINKKFFQLVQSDPEFKSKNNSQIWEAELFSILPRIKIQRIVVSDVMKRIFSDRYGQKTKAIQLFVRDEFFETNFQVRNTRKLRLVSSSANFNVPEKGLYFLLKALEQFSEKQNFKLILISGDPINNVDFNKYDFEIEEKTAENTKDMIKLLQQGDIYLNSSSRETFCLALAEAMVMGMPCVALDSIGNREYVDGKNAKFAKNRKEFLQGLKDLLDLEERKRVGKAAKKTMKKYNLEKTIKDFEKAIGARQ